MTQSNDSRDVERIVRSALNAAALATESTAAFAEDSGRWRQASLHLAAARTLRDLSTSKRWYVEDELPF